MIGIVLAGGMGTRLHPITKANSKQILPVYDKPMIYYPITNLIELGCEEIVIISDPVNIYNYEKLLMPIENLGLKLKYVVQSEPNGLPEAFTLTEHIIKNRRTILVLGDNFFDKMSKLDASNLKSNNAIFFSTTVDNPSAFGVVKYEGARPISVVEKPKHYVSDQAVVGLYCFPPDVVEKTKQLKRSARGEYEIADLINLYMNENRAIVKKIDDEVSWKDMGTIDDLLDTSNFVRAYQHNNGKLIGSIEYILFKQGIISEYKLEKYLVNQPKSGYFNTLRSLISDD